MRYFIVSLENFESEGPYTIYFNNISNGNIPQIFENTEYAENLTTDTLLSGVTIQVPDNTTNLIIYDTSLCQSYKEINILPLPINYPSFCFSIIGSPFTQGASPEITQIDFQFNGNITNNKPEYTDPENSYLIYWDGTNWNLDGFNVVGTITSPTQSDVPTSGWIVNGQFSSLYTISVNEGICQNINPTTLNIVSFPPTCVNTNNGQITISVIGGQEPFEYSIDGVNFYQEGPEFTFLNVSQGSYNVIVNDANGTYTQLVSLTAEQQVNYTPVFQFMQPITGLNQLSGCINKSTPYGVSGSLVLSPTLPTSIPNISLLLKVVVGLEYSQPGSASISNINIAATNGTNVINFTQSQPFQFISSGIACSNPNFSILTGFTSYNANTTMSSQYPITFNVTFNLNLDKCEVLETCQTIAKMRVQIYAQDLQNSYGRSCAQFLNASYDTGLVEVTCINNPCNA
jgi:hypothetical protein